VVAGIDAARREAEVRLANIDAQLEQARVAVDRAEQWLERTFDKLDTEQRDEVTQADFVMFVCDLEMEEEELPHCGTNGGRTVCVKPQLANATRVCAGDSTHRPEPILQRDYAEKMFAHMAQGRTVVSRDQFRTRAVDACLEAVDLAAENRRRRRQSFRYTVL